MSLTRVYAIFLRQVFLIKSNPTRLATIFLWVIVDILQWGYISKYLGSLGQSTFSFVTVILGAIILWEFVTRTQHGLMRAFLEDIWTQNFINYFASPLEIREYLTGLVTTGIATSLTGFWIMVLIAGLAFGYSLFRIGLFLLPFIMILFLFGIAMGFFVSAIIFRLGPSGEWLGWPVPLILSIFSGVYYPISTLPAPLQIVAKIMPPCYVFESMRTILSTGSFSAVLYIDLLVGLSLAMVYLWLTYKLFILTYRYNLKTGAIARFNAEAL
ncbi:MAG: ABC transporter permease [Thermodesulfobacteriota bacterium]